MNGMMKKGVAELIGTYWLVLGGCGSAVLAAAFPDVGIGLLGVALAFGLTVVTMAYAIGHISGCHLNPAVTVGLWAGGRFPARDILPYIVAQVLGRAFRRLHGLHHRQRPGRLCAWTEWPCRERRRRSFAGRLFDDGRRRHRNRDDGLFPADHHGLDPQPRPGRLRAAGDRPRADPDPSDLDPGHQHIGQSGAQHRPGADRRRHGACNNSGYSGWRRSSAASSAAASIAGFRPTKRRSPTSREKPLPKPLGPGGFAPSGSTLGQCRGNRYRPGSHGQD